jgi:hypothetical protein
MEGTERRLATMGAHVDAARRLRAGVARHPEARRGLSRCLRFHLAGAATLANEIGCGARAETRAPAAIRTTT